MKREMCTEPILVSVKELTQQANRLRFHFEKALFAVVASAVFLVAALAATGGSVGIETMARFGRGLFFSVSGAACAMLAGFTLVTASGIIMSERIGRRLDILRITPLSMRTIVLGKGAALMTRSLLVLGLLAPILAAARFYGGVSASDVGKALALIVADVAVFTGIGLYVSAGAHTNLDRGVRSAEWVIALLFATSPFGAIGIKVPYIGALSPSVVWALLVEARLSWLAVLVNFVFFAGLGCLMVLMTVRRLEIAARTEESAPREPKFKDFVSAVSRVRRSKGKTARVSKQRAWAGTLVGNELNQTSMLSIVPPLAVAVPPVCVVVIRSLGRLTYGEQETVYLIAAILMMVLSVVITFQSCAAIAREKQRHTAEVLATTPAGGMYMVAWKSSAILLSQAVALVLLVLLLMKPNGSWMFRIDARITHTANALAFLLLLWAAGMSFSLLCKSPFSAAALLVGSVFIAAPLLTFHLPRFLRAVIPYPWRSESYMILAGWCLVALGSVLVLTRNLAGRWAAAVLAVALPFAIAGSGFLCGGWTSRSNRSIYRSIFVLPFQTGNMDVDIVVRSAIFCVALSALLIGGMLLRFTRAFLSGARPKE